MEIERILEVEREFEEDVKYVKDIRDIERIKVKFLGKKEGKIPALLKIIPEIDKEQRKDFGARVNFLKEKIERKLSELLKEIEEKEIEEKILSQRANITLPGKVFPVGGLHPVIRAMDEIIDIFQSMGFDVEEGPEIETDYYNFEGLNIPKDHPARDMQDTFYIEKGKYLLRTHTSPVQIRVMEKRKPPLRVIVPGKVFRRDFDISHSPTFHQVEGFAVGKDISFAEMKGVISLFLKSFFGSDIQVRFRPSYFPFTEPSAEVDISCMLCNGKGCRTCGTGYFEVMGCGMIHPNVLKNCYINPDEHTGFAFGMGVERLTMLKFGISDIRLFYESNIDFLENFR